jgi:hypothetical protein
MEIINYGTDDLRQMAALSCCWPPGTESFFHPTEEQ